MKYHLCKRCENCFEETVYATPWGEFCGSCGFGMVNLEMTIDDAWTLRERQFENSAEKQVCVWCHAGWAYPTGETTLDDKDRVGHWFKHGNCQDFIGVWIPQSSSDMVSKSVVG